MVIINNGEVMIYTPQVRAAIKSIPVPHEFIVDFIEYDIDPKHPFIGLRFYESQWAWFSEKERLNCLSYLESVKKVLTGFGINATLEPTIDSGETLPDKFKSQGRGNT
jgi:hypothetical protein